MSINWAISPASVLFSDASPHAAFFQIKGSHPNLGKIKYSRWEFQYTLVMRCERYDTCDTLEPQVDGR